MGRNADRVPGVPEDPGTSRWSSPGRSRSPGCKRMRLPGHVLPPCPAVTLSNREVRENARGFADMLGRRLHSLIRPDAQIRSIW